MNPDRHAADLIRDLGQDSALATAEEFLSLGWQAQYGPEYWRQVVAAIKRTIAADLARGSSTSKLWPSRSAKWLCPTTGLPVEDCNCVDGCVQCAPIEEVIS